MMLQVLKSSRSVLLTTAAAALLSGSMGASAQTAIPPEMRNQAMTLASICKADYEQLCPRVQPGGGRILGCLNANLDKLSAACRTAMPDALALAARATASGVMPK
jgi:hypothetical protein